MVNVFRIRYPIIKPYFVSSSNIILNAIFVFFINNNIFDTHMTPPRPQAFEEHWYAPSRGLV